jgi:ParB-like chromosome segregation protein Spo0J
MYESRITRTERVDPNTLLAHPDNYVVHTEEQEAAMLAVITQVGITEPILVSEASGRIIDGHMRVALAVRHSIPTIPVSYVQLTEEEERKALLYLKRTTGMARFDLVHLDEVLSSLQVADDALTGLVSAFEKESGLLAKREREKPRPHVEYAAISIGPLTFQVSWAAYAHWRGQLHAQYRTRHDTINYIIRQRLGLLTEEERQQSELA